MSRRRRSGAPAPLHGPAAAPVASEGGPEALEVSPLARVKRSRIAFALSVTLAAVPLLVLDNMSATAETNEARVEVSSGADERAAAAPSTTVTTESSTTTTVAPTTTAAPAPTTEAPPTTQAVVLQAYRAPAPVTPPPTAPPTTSPPAPPGPYGDPSDPATWDRLAQCESSGNWAMNSGNGYYGGLQFSLATWQSVGGSGYPHQASRAEQIKRGQILQARAGWGQWPHCSRQLGY